MSEGETPAVPGPFAAVILAAGKGTRMKSGLHKVMHPIAGRPMLLHLLATVERLEPVAKVIVVGSLGEQVEAAVEGLDVRIVAQDAQLGTAHAVLQAKGALQGFDGIVLVLYGDVPLVDLTTMDAMLTELELRPEIACVVLGFRPVDPAKYGRIITGDDNRILKMVEFKDATEAERRVELCNSGIMAIRSADLWPLLERVENRNASREYYLPDVVMLAAADGRESVMVSGGAGEVMGINDRWELAAAEAFWQRHARAGVMTQGATLIDPDTVWFSYDTVIGRDVVIEPNVRFGPGVTIGDRVTIHAFSDIEGAIVKAGAAIGPYARLRPGAEVGEGAKVGNFVEIKKAVLGPGAKANHLSYIGDATVGPGANIGAGTITCNYDGFFKYRTEIGAGAFIGSNTALVAPVTIGEGAIVGAGSVVTSDVEAGALALARGRQEAKPGWARRFREMMGARKKTAKGS